MSVTLIRAGGGCSAARVARGCAGDVHRVASRAPIRGRLANVSALIVAVVTRRTLIAQFEHLFQTCTGVSPRLNLQPVLYIPTAMLVLKFSFD